MEYQKELESHWLTVADVARRLQVAESTVWRWIREGTLDSVKIGRTRRIPSETLAALLGRPLTVRETSPVYAEESSKRPRKLEESYQLRVWRELLAEIEEADRQVLERRNGQPLPDSADDIRALREDR